MPLLGESLVLFVLLPLAMLRESVLVICSGEGVCAATAVKIERQQDDRRLVSRGWVGRLVEGAADLRCHCCCLCTIRGCLTQPSLYAHASSKLTMLDASPRALIVAVGVSAFCSQFHSLFVPDSLGLLGATLLRVLPASPPLRRLETSAPLKP